MDRLSILIGRLNKPVAHNKYFFKVQQIGRFMPLVNAIYSQGSDSGSFGTGCVNTISKEMGPFSALSE